MIPATGAMAAKRSAMVQASVELIIAPIDRPVAYTRLSSMQRSAPTVSSTEVTKARSGLVSSRLVFHCTGAPVPWGNATMKPSASARSLKADIRACTSAPSDRPWKSSTSGTGVSASWASGSVRRKYRSTPARSRVRFSSRTVVAVVVDEPHPADGTGSPSPAAVVSVAVVSVAVVSVDEVGAEAAWPLSSSPPQPATSNAAPHATPATRWTAGRDGRIDAPTVDLRPPSPPCRARRGLRAGGR